MATKIEKREVRRAYKDLVKVARTRYGNSFETEFGREDRIRDCGVLNTDINILEGREVVNGAAVELAQKYAVLGKCLEDAAIASIAMQEPRTARFWFSVARRGYKKALKLHDDESELGKNLVKKIKSCYDGERACGYELVRNVHYR